MGDRTFSTLIVHGYSARVAIRLRRYSANPFCGSAALVGD